MSWISGVSTNLFRCKKRNQKPEWCNICLYFICVWQAWSSGRAEHQGHHHVYWALPGSQRFWAHHLQLRPHLRSGPHVPHSPFLPIAQAHKKEQHCWKSTLCHVCKSSILICSCDASVCYEDLSPDQGHAKDMFVPLQDGNEPECHSSTCLFGICATGLRQGRIINMLWTSIFALYVWRSCCWVQHWLMLQLSYD